MRTGSTDHACSLGALRKRELVLGLEARRTRRPVVVAAREGAQGGVELGHAGGVVGDAREDAQHGAVVDRA